MAIKRKNHDSAYKYLFKSKHIFLQLLDLESDLLYRIRKGGKQHYIYILLEFQSTVDKSIPLRMGLYILMLYDQLYRHSRRGVLPNVFPLLLYSGKKRWTIPLNLRDLVARRIPARYIPILEYYPIILRDIPDLGGTYGYTAMPFDLLRLNEAGTVFVLQTTDVVMHDYRLRAELLLGIIEGAKLRMGLTVENAWAVDKATGEPTTGSIPEPRLGMVLGISVR